jgi:hypothetical protein
MCQYRRKRCDPGANGGDEYHTEVWSKCRLMPLVSCAKQVCVSGLRMAGNFSEGMLFDIGYQDEMNPVPAAPEFRARDGTRAGW